VAAPLEVARRGAATQRVASAVTGEEMTAAAPLEVARRGVVVHHPDGEAA
jgi:hypothetical protein